MRSLIQSHALPGLCWHLGNSELRRSDTALGLAKGWWSAEGRHDHFVWETRLLVAVCHYIWKEICVFFLISGMGTSFHTTVEIWFQSTQVHYFPYHSNKISTPVNQKCNSDHSFQCSTFSALVFAYIAPSILLFSVSLFLQIFSFLLTLIVSNYLLINF